ncbi:MAG: SoxR reducing system RseC family protein [Proteobacteria bacterium]|jgi:sigma-E factor negative regulatory protein RseC|nr:SoxR reducing system RseC family protein [Pseudomonadota bacterium]
MIEQTAVVVELDGNFAWVQAERESSCGNCAVKSGCGTSVLSRVIGNKFTRMRVINNLHAQVGETVIVGLKEAAMLKGSVAIYLMPLLFMILFSITGKLIAGQMQLSAEMLSIVFGVVGLVVGGFWLRRFSRRIQNDDHYQPVILKKGREPVKHELPVSQISS